MTKKRESKLPSRKTRYDQTNDPSIRAKLEFYGSVGAAYFKGHILEKLVTDIIEYASKPDSFDLQTFRIRYGIPLKLWENLIMLRPELKEVCQQAHELIEANLLAAKGMDGYSKLLYQISPRWKQAEEYHAGLRKYEQPATTDKAFKNVFGEIPVKETNGDPSDQ